MIKLAQAELLHQYKVLQEEILLPMTLDEAEAAEAQEQLELLEMVDLELEEQV